MSDLKKEIILIKKLKRRIKEFEGDKGCPFSDR